MLFSIATKGFYIAHETTFSQPTPQPTTHYRTLTKHNTKQLCHVLRAPNFPTCSKQQEKYERKTKYLISELPSHLQASPAIRNQAPDAYISGVTNSAGRLTRHYLCATHKGLERKLIHSIWSFIKRSLDHSIGKFIYPVIMLNNNLHNSTSQHRYLTPAQELDARQLEPVLRMYHPTYAVLHSTPRGKSPIAVGDKWEFLRDGCAACMLARIGEDQAVLCALLAGIVAHIGSKRSGTRKCIKSTRLRFLKRWIIAGDFLGGRKAVDRAWELGRILRAARKDMKRRGVILTPEADEGIGVGEDEDMWLGRTVLGRQGVAFAEVCDDDDDPFIDPPINPFADPERTPTPPVRNFPHAQHDITPSAERRRTASASHLAPSVHGNVDPYASNPPVDRSRLHVACVRNPVPPNSNINSNSNVSTSQGSQLSWNKLQGYDGRSAVPVTEEAALRGDGWRVEEKEGIVWLPRMRHGSVYGGFDGLEDDVEEGYWSGEDGF